MVRRVILISLMLILQVACSAQISTPTISPDPRDQTVSSTKSPSEPELFKVKVWINDPTPSLNSLVIVRGSLIRYGRYYVGGIMMSAFWPDNTHERGVPNCFTSVNYGDGKCMIDVSHFPPGEFVPVTISFNYQEKIYTAETGFTPQEP